MNVRIEPLSQPDLDKVFQFLRNQVDNPPAENSIEGILFNLAWAVVDAHGDISQKVAEDFSAEIEVSNERLEILNSRKKSIEGQ